MATLPHQLLLWQTKRCSRCRQDLSLDQFHRCASKRDGLQTTCRVCKAKHVRARVEAGWWKKWYRDQDVAGRRRARYATDVEYRTRIQRHNRRSHEKHGKRWYYSDIERSRARARYGQMRYKARKVGARGHCTMTQLAGRWEMWGGNCYLCGAAATATDHVIPLSRGGTNWPANLRPVCGHCNSTKRAKDWRGFVGSAT